MTVKIDGRIIQGIAKIPADSVEDILALFRPKYGSMQVDHWYGGDRGGQKVPIFIEVEK